MKRLFKYLLLVLLFIPCIVFGSEKKLNLYLFYGDGCPHCAALEKYLDSYLKDKDYINLYTYEVWYNQDNLKKYDDLHELLNDTGNGIPYLIIGGTTISGFSEKYTPEKI